MKTLQTNLIRASAQKGKAFLGQLMLAIYPPVCLICRAQMFSEGLCSNCWENAHFIADHACRFCGTPMPGHSDDVPCDSCLYAQPPWIKGRAAMVYEGGAQRLILALKHGDRLDLAKPMARWMVNHSKDLMDVDIIAPVPLHRTRFFRRRYNQAALLGDAISEITGIMQVPDLISRFRRTAMQKDMSRKDRLENQRAALRISAKYEDFVKGKKILLVDDVMTTGATLSACTEACLAAGSAEVNVLVFARVARS